MVPGHYGAVVDKAFLGAVGDAVGGAVYGAIGGAVGDAVYGAVYGAVDGAVGLAKKLFTRCIRKLSLVFIITNKQVSSLL